MSDIRFMFAAAWCVIYAIGFLAFKAFVLPYLILNIVMAVIGVFMLIIVLVMSSFTL